MFRSLLVPLDGSSFGEHALALALSIARRAGARLDLVHVHVPLAFARVDSTLVAEADQQVQEQAREYLQGVVQRVSAVSSVPVTSTLLVGDVVENLLSHIQAHGVDLVVMTTHGRGPLSRFWLGSIALGLVRRASIPLLLTRPQEDPPNLESEPVFRRILIPLDGSESAETILESALALGRLMEADYRLLRVVPPVMLAGYDHIRHGKTGFKLPVSELLETEARTYLERVRKRLQDHSITTQMRIVTDLHPAAAILDDAQTHNVDLIALQPHGRSSLARLFLGSVADKVVRGASVPVLLHRPPDEQ